MHPDDVFPLSEEIYYGAPASKNAYQSILDAMLYGKFKDPVEPAPSHYLMLGGFLHGQFIATYGDHTFKALMPPKPTLASFYEEPTALVKEKIVVYTMRKLHVPGLIEKIPVYYPEGTSLGDQDYYLGKWIKEHMGPQAESKKPSNGYYGFGKVSVVPTPKPEPRKDGLQITIGGRTVVWEDLDTNQVAGLMQWAAQSLGAGKDLDEEAA